MKTKIHSKILNNWSYRHIPFQKGKTGEYRIAVRQGLEQYLISNPTASGISEEKFAEMESNLATATALRMAIKIEFVRKYNKNWIKEIN